jgi:hypothetical protein
MGQRVKKATPKRANRAWRQAIVRGMAESRNRRIEAGLMTVAEVAADLCLPKSTVADMFPVIVAGSHRYIRVHEVERWKAETGGESAA